MSKSNRYPNPHNYIWYQSLKLSPNAVVYLLQVLGEYEISGEVDPHEQGLHILLVQRLKDLRSLSKKLED